MKASSTLILTRPNTLKNFLADVDERALQRSVHTLDRVAAAVGDAPRRRAREEALPVGEFAGLHAHPAVATRDAFGEVHEWGRARAAHGLGDRTRAQAAGVERACPPGCAVGVRAGVALEAVLGKTLNLASNSALFWSVDPYGGIGRSPWSSSGAWALTRWPSISDVYSSKGWSAQTVIGPITT